jgi:hypothetical protein
MYYKNIIFIAGAPRCGTTSIFNYLSDHPDICGAEIKESCYFMDKNYFGKKYKQNKLPNFSKYGMQGFMKLFDHHSNEQFLLEGTTEHMYQNTFYQILRKLDEKPYVLIVLREPASRIHSLFRYAQGNLSRISGKIQFDQFLDMVNQKDNVLKDHNSLLNCIDHSIYVKYLKIIKNIVGPTKLIICLYEDMINNPKNTMIEVSERLKIDPKFYNTYEFKRTNESYILKTQALQKFYHRIPIPINLRYKKNKFRDVIKTIYIKLLAKKEKDSDNLNPEIIHNLKSYFKKYNEELGENFNIDINTWNG